MMQKSQIVMILLLTIASFGFIKCSKEKSKEIKPVDLINPDTISFAHSMKGWELYSWPNGSDWNYSILIGTNRLKSYEEVTTNKIIVTGTDSLKMLLDKLPVNESLFWIGEEWLKRCWNGYHGDLSLPDTVTINDIKEYCIQKGILLNISN
jgi:hypothetical protein